MTPTDVKELLKTLIAEDCLPIDVIDIAPSQDLEAHHSTTEARIKDVISQWNKDGRIPVLSLGLPEIMEFYTKTDAASPAKELLESLAVEAFLETVVSEQGLPIRFTDCGFRLITLAADDTTRYPVKILHGSFRLDRRLETEVQPSHLQNVADRFEVLLKEKGIKAKMFHRGFQLEKRAEAEVPLSRIKKLAEQIDAAFGINYVLNSYKYTDPDGASEMNWSRASICVSLWRFPRR